MHFDCTRLRAGVLVIFGLTIVAAATRNRCPAQPYLPFYEGPGYDGTTGVGYTGPGFRFIPSVGDASTGRLLNEAGTATWYANAHPPAQGPLRALRWNPPTGPADQLGAAIGVDAAISFAINDDETVVGSANTISGPRAALWNAGGSGLHILQVNSNFISRAAQGAGTDFSFDGFASSAGTFSVVWQSQASF